MSERTQIVVRGLSLEDLRTLDRVARKAGVSRNDWINGYLSDFAQAQREFELAETRQIEQTEVIPDELVENAEYVAHQEWIHRPKAEDY